MRSKAILIVAVAVVAVAFAGVARADFNLLDFQQAVNALDAVDPTIAPPANDPATDFAVGGFQGEEGNNVGFSAHSGPQGQNPQGRVSETIPHAFQGRYTVTCFSVLGPNAALGLHPTAAASNDSRSEFVLSVYDTGLPGGAGDKYAFSPDAAGSCPLHVADAVSGPFFIVRGNLSVHDG